MKAKAIKYSSVVGASLVVMTNEKEERLFQIAAFAVTIPEGTTLRDQSNKITEYLAQLINENKDREGQPY